MADPILEEHELDELVQAAIDAWGTSNAWVEFMQGGTGKLQRGAVLGQIGAQGAGTQHLEYDVVVVRSAATAGQRQSREVSVASDVIVYVAHRLGTRADQRAQLRSAWRLASELRRVVTRVRHPALASPEWTTTETLVSASLSIVTMAIRLRFHHAIRT